MPAPTKIRGEALRTKQKIERHETQADAALTIVQADKRKIEKERDELQKKCDKLQEEARSKAQASKEMRDTLKGVEAERDRALEKVDRLQKSLDEERSKPAPKPIVLEDEAPQEQTIALAEHERQLAEAKADAADAEARVEQATKAVEKAEAEEAAAAFESRRLMRERQVAIEEQSALQLKNEAYYKRIADLSKAVIAAGKSNLLAPDTASAAPLKNGAIASLALCDDLRKQVETLKIEAGKNKQRLVDQTKELAAVTARERDAVARATKLEESAKTAQNTVKRSAEAASEMINEAERLRKVITDLKETHEKAMKRKEEQLEYEKGGVEREKQRSKERQAQLNEEVKDLREQVKDSESQLQDRATKLSDLKTKIKKLQADAVTAEEEQIALQKEIESFKSKDVSATMTNRTRQMQADLEAAKVEIKRLEANAAEAKLASVEADEARAANVARAELAAENVKLRDEISRMKAAAPAKSVTRVFELESEVIGQKRTITSLEQRLAQAEEQQRQPASEELAAELATVRAQLANAEKAVESLKAQYMKLQDDNQKLRKKTNQLATAPGIPSEFPIFFSNLHSLLRTINDDPDYPIPYLELPYQALAIADPASLAKYAAAIEIVVRAAKQQEQAVPPPPGLPMHNGRTRNADSEIASAAIMIHQLEDELAETRRELGEKAEELDRVKAAHQTQTAQYRAQTLEIQQLKSLGSVTSPSRTSTPTRSGLHTPPLSASSQQQSNSDAVIVELRNRLKKTDAHKDMLVAKLKDLTAEIARKDQEIYRLLTSSDSPVDEY